ncbi:MAG TPA: hypothetical protein VMS32_02180 [Verrucomicrobiae bacterium]|jgi:hypothetical protein|nr:hypothetical protein [Verrucomicrobiae bacterium]
MRTDERIGRASFLRSGAATAAAVWLGSTGLGTGNTPDSPPSVLEALVRTVLPFEHPRFPSIPSSAIVDRIDELFGLLSSPAFPASLAYFNTASRPTVFVNLDAGGRRAYLAAWAHDASEDRRRFYMSIRAVTFFGFYSLPQSWPAIDYGEPILHREKAGE